MDFKVTQKLNDLGELDNMALRAKKLVGGKEFEVLADKGYYKAEDLKKCVEKGITPYVTQIDLNIIKKKMSTYVLPVKSSNMQKLEREKAL